jgi:TolA-binding protein
MRFDCAATGSLLAGRSAGLSEADRLRLESHLADCASCRDDAVWLDALGELADGAAGLSPRQRERAVAAAIDADPVTALPGAAPRRRAGMLIGVAAAAGLVVAGAAALRDGDPGPSVAAPATARELPTADLTAAPARPRAPAADRAAQPAPARTGPAAAAEDQRPARDQQPLFAADDERAAPSTYRAELVRRSATDWLNQARSALARGHRDRAEQAVEAALKADPSRRERAEAGTLRAEMALVAGSRDRAARLFLEVADRFAGSRAAENALMAAARLMAAEGDRAGARATWQRYLDDYPDGRFRDDASRRLAAP